MTRSNKIIYNNTNCRMMNTWLVFWGNWKGGQLGIEIAFKHAEYGQPWESSVHLVCYHHVTWTVAVAWLWCHDDTSRCITSMCHMDSWLGNIQARVAWHMWCHGVMRCPEIWSAVRETLCNNSRTLESELHDSYGAMRAPETSQERSATGLSRNFV